MFTRKSFNGVSLPLLIVSVIVLFIFNKNIHFGYMSVKRFLSGIDGFYVTGNHEFLLFYMLFLIFLELIPISIVNLTDYFSYKKRIKYDRFAETSRILYGTNKKRLVYPVLLIALFITLFAIISSYTVFAETKIKSRTYLFVEASRNYLDIESMVCDTQYVYKSTDPVIIVKFTDNHTLDIGGVFIHEIDDVKKILDKCRPNISKNASRKFIDTYLNKQEKLFYTQNFNVN